MIAQAVHAYLAAKPERKSHRGLSVSDISNGCPRAAWHRIHHGVRKDFPDNVRVSMRMGLQWEPVVEAALEASGAQMVEPMVCVFPSFQDAQNGHFPGARTARTHLVDVDTFDADPSAHAAPDHLVGHPDLVFIKDGELYVGEIKTTGYAPDWPDLATVLSKQGQYIHQLTAYAYAYKAKAVLYVAGRNRGDCIDFEFDPAEYWPLFLERWKLMLPALDASKEPEPLVPPWTINKSGTSYLCGGCPVTSCKNAR